MTDLITTIFTIFTSNISSLVDGIKYAFISLIYAYPDDATSVINNFTEFGFILISSNLTISFVFLIIIKASINKIIQLKR